MSFYYDDFSDKSFWKLGIFVLIYLNFNSTSNLTAKQFDCKTIFLHPVKSAIFNLLEYNTDTNIPMHKIHTKNNFIFEKPAFLHNNKQSLFSKNPQLYINK